MFTLHVCGRHVPAAVTRRRAWRLGPRPGSIPRPQAGCSLTRPQDRNPPQGRPGSDSTPTLSLGCCLGPWREAGPEDTPGTKPVPGRPLVGSLGWGGIEGPTGPQALSGTCRHRGGCPYTQLSQGSRFHSLGPGSLCVPAGRADLGWQVRVPRAPRCSDSSGHAGVAAKLQVPAQSPSPARASSAGASP